MPVKSRRVSKRGGTSRRDRTPGSVKSPRGAVRSPRGARRSAGTAVRVLVLSGPNLDRLGRREPNVYGSTTLAEIGVALQRLAESLGARVDFRQSNHEGKLIDWISEAADGAADAILINPGALTHTSLAIYDALRGAGLVAVEVHLSNPAARETFRHASLVAPACTGIVAGFGAQSYELALRAVVSRVRGG